MDTQLKSKLIKWGWLDYLGRSIEWFTWNKPDRTMENPRGGRDARSKNHNKDNQRVSKDDSRPFKKPVKQR